MTAGILEGITRDSVMRIAEDMGMTVIERDITRSELYVADEVFMTGTAAEVQPIHSIDNIIIGQGMPGPITKKLQQALMDATRAKSQKYIGWLDFV